MELSKEEISRYSRNIFLQEIGIEGQLRLKKSKVLVVGAGGLGSPLLLYLTASGIGTIVIIEYDRVDITNLQRQILYKTSDIGQEKIEILVEQLQQLNPEVNIIPIREKLSSRNAWQYIDKVDLVLDGTDNFPTRFLIHDVCYFKKIPLISGGVLQFYGLILGILPDQTPCYRCIFEKPPVYAENCSTVGVLGASAGVVGSMMGVETVKYLLHLEPSIMGNLLRMDMRSYEFRFTPMPYNSDCVLCGSNPLIKEFDPDFSDYYEMCTTPLTFLQKL